MRIKQILVRDLFGMFNHEINLNLEDRITIIHGPNGVGKTILLCMINAIFNSSYSELRPIPFTTLTINFDDGSSLAVDKINHHNNAEKEAPSKIKFSFLEPDNLVSFEMDKEPSEQDVLIVSILSQILTKMHEKLKEKAKNNSLTNKTKSEVKTIVEQISKFISQEYSMVDHMISLSEKIDKININFIATERLKITRPKNEDELSIKEQDSMDVGDESIFYSVTTYADELAEQIQSNLAEYATLSQSLDRTFPARVVKQKFDENLTEEMLREKFNKIESQRQRLIKVGLLNDENSDFELGQNIDPNTKQILSVYLEDVEKKLSVFQELARKIELFQKIIATKFQYKHMQITKDKGFTFTTHDGNPLAPTYLSSGEQHELVMLYELLFKVKPNSLILIDEPELSLHVGWQVEFIEDLQQIAQLGNFDVLMATHSPSLISDRWDLTVALKG